VKRIHHDGPLIIGGGLAGLSAALSVEGKALVVSPVPLLQAASSAWAQGGVAAALSTDDAPALHAADTLAAGAGFPSASKPHIRGPG
jgi:L-aspartate oxidase